ncbi:MAG: hypothetical protein ACFLMY_02555 [Candidatus Brachytrichaceae bacterium NZ_4S206]
MLRMPRIMAASVIATAMIALTACGATQTTPTTTPVTPTIAPAAAPAADARPLFIDFYAPW